MTLQEIIFYARLKFNANSITYQSLRIYNVVQGSGSPMRTRTLSKILNDPALNNDAHSYAKSPAAHTDDKKLNVPVRQLLNENVSSVSVIGTNQYNFYRDSVKETMFDDSQYPFITREINPKEHANIFSILTFAFTWDTIKKGYRKDINEDNIYKTLKKHDSNILADKLEEEWKKESKVREPTIFKILLKVFGKQYFAFGLIQLLFKTPTTILRTIVLQKILVYYGKNVENITQQDALYYGLGFILCTIILTVYTHTYLLCLQEMGLKIRVALCSLIYRKCLQLRSAKISEISSGKTVTLVSKDVREFENFLITLQDACVGIVHIFVFTYLMYTYVGIAALISVAVMLLFIPFQLCLSRATTSRRLKTAAQSDKRLRMVQEVLSSIRMIKMYTWENYFAKIMNKCRTKELKHLRFVFYLKSLIQYLGAFGARVALFACGIYYVSTSDNVTAANIYLIISCMNTIRMVIAIDIPKAMGSVAEVRSSLMRIQQMLSIKNTKVESNGVNDSTKNPYINMQNVLIRSKDNKQVLTANLRLEKSLVALTGPVGSGKTIFLKTLLGDLEYEGDLKVNGNISYAAQEPWLFPGTIKQNILFGKPFIKDRYEKIVKVCALEKDIFSMPKGDETLVTDEGICLSRGQQDRINLARALYKEADIYLIDNCFSSLDANISKYVFENCVRYFLSDKLCIFVSTKNSYLHEADLILSINDGKIETTQTGFIRNTKYQDDLDVDIHGLINQNKDSEANDPSKNDTTTLLRKKSHMYYEDQRIGKVKFGVYKEYFKNIGYFYIVLLLIAFSVWQVGSSSFELFIKTWANVEEEFALQQNHSLYTNNTTELHKLMMKRSRIHNRYYIIMAAVTTAYLVKTTIFYALTARTSKKLHNLTFLNVIKAKLCFFDANLLGNILNRFSKDFAATDEYLPEIFDHLLQYTFMCIGSLVLMSSQNIFLGVVAVVFITFAYLIRFYYMHSCRSLKRLEAATRSPVIGQLKTSLEGLNTIRSSGLASVLRKQFLKTSLEGLNTIRSSGLASVLRKQFDTYQNLHTSADFMYMCTYRALAFWVELICTLYQAIVILICLFVLHSPSPGAVGMIIMQALGFVKGLQLIIRELSDLENQMTSVERVLEYCDIETETTEGKTIEHWPKIGTIEYQNVKLRYPQTNQVVLKDLTFKIEPNERVCIIGRTGAGKSSILSTLFRLYDNEFGQVLIDDIDTSMVSLKTLRSGLSIIPQNPALFTGTFRSNLDPNGEHNDAELWKALKEINFEEFCIKNNIDLYTPINEGGRGFSAGQKQLICLARAMVLNNKILILDEATSYLDSETNDLIEKLITTKFSECTVLAILHRLTTVLNYDKVMILNDGAIVEYDNPNNLLNNKNSLFYKIMSEDK
ncbi:ABC transporter transmembrane region [Popillia japonica]|uniref:ABC transporter transmembrane region n=1 Tax=Popillia japonica TaxID=7064 RepID=A0AAW1MG51_POPJA